MINRLLKICIIAICVIFISININTIVYSADNHEVLHQIEEEQVADAATSSGQSNGPSKKSSTSHSSTSESSGTESTTNNGPSKKSSTSHSSTSKSSGTESTTNTDSGAWVSDAFSAASSFFSENVTDEMGIIEKPLNLFSDIVKAINTILIVALAGISAISLSIVGIRYIISIGGKPEQQGKAKHDLHKTIRGMAYGFGAFFIWQIAMGIVKAIVDGFATQP